jgi:hypothetical protein
MLNQPTALVPSSAVCAAISAAYAAPDATCTAAGVSGTTCTVTDNAANKGDRFNAAEVCAGSPTAPDYVIKYDNPTARDVAFQWDSCFSDVLFDITFAIYQVAGTTCNQVNCNDDRHQFGAFGTAGECGVGIGLRTAYLEHTIPARSSLVMVISAYSSEASDFTVRITEVASGAASAYAAPDAAPRAVVEDAAPPPPPPPPPMPLPPLLLEPMD